MSDDGEAAWRSWWQRRGMAGPHEAFLAGRESLAGELAEARNEIARLNGQTFEVVDREAIKAEAMREATEPTEERIEAMAKAIHDDENSAFDVDWGPGYFDNELVMTQDMFRRVARAALAALRRFEIEKES